MEFFKFRDKEYSVKLLKALTTMGIEIKVPYNKLRFVTNVKNTETIVIAHGEEFEVIARGSEMTDEETQTVRLFTKHTLKKALKPAPVAQRPWVDPLAHLARPAYPRRPYRDDYNNNNHRGNRFNDDRSY